MNDYPPEYDIEGCIEYKMGFIEVAWTENDAVYIRKPWAPSTERDDGFQYIGSLEWESYDSEYYCEEEAHNEARLHDFVQDYKDRARRETGETFVPPEVMEKLK